MTQKIKNFLKKIATIIGVVLIIEAARRLLGSSSYNEPDISPIEDAIKDKEGLLEEIAKSDPTIEDIVNEWNK